MRKAVGVSDKNTKREQESEQKLKEWETVERDVEYYLELPYDIQVVKFKNYFVVNVVELEGCFTQVPNEEDILSAILDAMRKWIGDALENGEVIPMPNKGENK